MTYGLSDKGFQRKTYTEILDDIKAKINSIIDSDLTFDETSPEGQLARIYADELDTVWESMEAVYYSQYPSTANGISLDRAAEYRGNLRLTPQPTTIGARIELGPQIELERGTRIEAPGGLILYTTEKLTSTEGGRFDTVLTSRENGAFSSLKIGQSLSSTLSGFVSGVTTEPLTRGTKFEEDPLFRRRIFAQGLLAGSGTVPAIEARLRRLDGVSAVKVIPNFGASIDDNGRPPNSIEIVILGGNDQDIAQEIFRVVAAGTTLLGDRYDIIDDTGTPRVVRFSRAVQVNIDVLVELIFETRLMPENNENLTATVQQLISDRINALPQGEEVATSPYLIGELRNIENLHSSSITVKRSSESEFVRYIDINDIEVARSSPPAVEVRISEYQGQGVTRRTISVRVFLRVSDDFPSNGQSLVEALVIENTRRIRPGDTVSKFTVLRNLTEIPGILYDSDFGIGFGENSGQFHIVLGSNEIPHLPPENLRITTSLEG